VKKLFIPMAAVAAGFAALHGQDFGKGQNFQVFGPAPGVRALDESFSNQVVKGKPFSATEERRFVQVLSDGNRIESNQTNRVFRDSQGRTRVEDMNGTVVIYDPVAGTRIELNPANRTARTSNVVLATTDVLNAIRTQVPGGKGGGARGAKTKGGPPENSESLPAQLVNGVMAQGTRTTTTIPRGQIGNDREIKVVTERWVSNELQTLIRSTNSDPRFGDTTYQLTGILEREQDPYLFQIPGDYTVGSNPGRGKGGPAPAGVTAPGGGRSQDPGGRKGGAPKSNLFGETPGIRFREK